MKIFTVNFITGAAQSNQFPDEKLPEIAFSGRSNVGKSSLLNNIALNKNIAKISSSPGKTRQINFFNVDNKWRMVDLPGFGYAAVSKIEREKFEKLNLEYLKGRKFLKLVCILSDSRHDPQKIELSLIEQSEILKVPYLIILTKCDKITNRLINERKEQWEQILSACSFHRGLIPYSVETNLGRKELVTLILSELTN
ncbi:MAG: ribosome biogenesis GTP-binding protein YihA/YsxC [Candidatus Kapabacteria bacterium]|nr:ribosome biogenesis GTP-binding protein YihA/YsxC [Candidatus Kapabacteria bacterium]